MSKIVTLLNTPASLRTGIATRQTSTAPLSSPPSPLTVPLLPSCSAQDTGKLIAIAGLNSLIPVDVTGSGDAVLADSPELAAPTITTAQTLVGEDLAAATAPASGRSKFGHDSTLESPTFKFPDGSLHPVGRGVLLCAPWTAAGIVATEVVRVSAAGVLAKAQADTLAHSTPIAGVWDGHNPVPFSTQPIVKFDSAPVIGAPCYLSATTAGALTCTTPPFGGIVAPGKLVVFENKTVGVAYAARVGINDAEVPALGLEQYLIWQAATRTGIAPQDVRLQWSSFDTNEMVRTAGTVTDPLIGRVVNGTTPTQIIPGRWVVDSGTVLYLILDQVLRNAQVTQQRWMAFCEVEILNNTNADFVFEVYRKGSLPAWVESIGVVYGPDWGGAAPPDPTHWWYYNCLDHSVSTSAWQYVDPIYGVDLGNPGTSTHRIVFWTRGDGFVYAEIDGVAMTPHAQGASFYGDDVALLVLRCLHTSTHLYGIATEQ